MQYPHQGNKQTNKQTPQPNTKSYGIIRLEPESKAFEKLLFTEAKKIFFPTVHYLLKQEE